MKNIFPTAAAAVLLIVKLVKVRWRANVYLPFSSSAFHSSPTKPLIRKRGNPVTPLFVTQQKWAVLLPINRWFSQAPPLWAGVYTVQRVYPTII